MTEEDLKEMFEEFGTVYELNVLRDKIKAESRGKMSFDVLFSSLSVKFSRTFLKGMGFHPYCSFNTRQMLNQNWKFFVTHWDQHFNLLRLK